MVALYILKAKKRFTGYCQNQNIVVRATSELEARDLAATEGGDDWYESDYATCETLSRSGEVGVIIVDNNGS